MYVFLILSSCNDKVFQENDIVLNPEVKTVEIYSVNSLDDPRGFCLDIKGYKESADIKKDFKFILATPTREI